MSMRNLVAHDLAEDEVGVEGFALRQGDLACGLEVSGGIFVVPNPAGVLLGNDLGMSRRLRVYIQESQELIVFIDDMSRYLVIDDFAENTVRHEASLAQRSRVGSSKVRKVENCYAIYSIRYKFYCNLGSVICLGCGIYDLNCVSCTVQQPNYPSVLYFSAW